MKDVIVDEYGVVISNTGHAREVSYLIKDKKITSDTKHFISRISRKYKVKREHVERVIKDTIK